MQAEAGEPSEKSEKKLRRHADTVAEMTPEGRLISCTVTSPTFGRGSRARWLSM
jgi:hypothetical protein